MPSVYDEELNCGSILSQAFMAFLVSGLFTGVGALVGQDSNLGGDAADGAGAGFAISLLCYSLVFSGKLIHVVIAGLPRQQYHHTGYITTFSSLIIPCNFTGATLLANFFKYDLAKANLFAAGGTLSLASLTLYVASFTKPHPIGDSQENTLPIGRKNVVKALLSGLLALASTYCFASALNENPDIAYSWVGSCAFLGFIASRIASVPCCSDDGDSVHAFANSTSSSSQTSAQRGPANTGAASTVDRMEWGIPRAADTDGHKKKKNKNENQGTTPTSRRH